MSDGVEFDHVVLVMLNRWCCVDDVVLMMLCKCCVDGVLLMMLCR